MVPADVPMPDFDEVAECVRKALRPSTVVAPSPKLQIKHVAEQYVDFFREVLN